MTSCYVVGEICLDVHVPRFERMPQPGELLLSQGLSVTLGGSAAYTAVALRRLGLAAWLKGKAGLDQTASILRFLLEREHVKVNLEIDQGEYSEVALAFAYPQGKGYIAGRPITSLPTKEDLQIAGVKALHLAGYLLFPELWNEPTLELLQWAKDNNILVTLDSQMCVEPGRELELLNGKLLSMVDVLFMDRHEVGQFFGTEDVVKAVDELRGLGAQIVSVKMGKAGSLTVTQDQIYRQPAVVVEAVNTVGAGDIYNGAFIYGMLQNWPLDKIAGFANIIAGFSTTMKHDKNILAVDQALKVWEQQQEAFDNEQDVN